MVFLRGRNPENVVWPRFRKSVDGFSVREADGLFEVQVSTSADRAVDLFHALLEDLSPAVAVSIDDYRSGAKWEGDGVALPDVRDAIARLKLPLATYAGAEISVYTEDDQVTLTALLDVHLYSRTERWIYLLRGKGLVEHPRVRERSWRLGRGEFAAAPDMTLVLRAAAERLSLGEA
jgi:hypothetical protein